jgi:hypothetical protein
MQVRIAEDAATLDAHAAVANGEDGFAPLALRAEA